MSDSFKPNVLFVMTDQQRYDSLSCVGRSICRTPHLDKLASEGVRFDDAYSVCALCSPARASMLTGRYPHNHRMWNNNDMMQWAIRDLPDSEHLISEYLVEAGYNCGYAGKWHCGHNKVPSTYGFVGMDVPDFGNPYTTKEYANYLATRGLEPFRIEPRRRIPPDVPVEAYEPHFLAEFAIDLMKRFNEELERIGKPFMMFVSFWGPHPPYTIPEPYTSMYDPAEVEIWPNFHDDLRNKPHVQERFRRSCIKLSEDGWRETIAKCWGYCTFLDDEIGRLVTILNDMGRTNDTLVLFSTDHGDMTGSHGGFFDKGPFMYEETYHIPMVIRWPGVTPVGRVSNRFVSNMDLATTVLEVAGVPLPRNLDGRSLMPLLHDPNADWRNDIMCEFHGHRYLYSQRMVRWDKYKFIFNAPDYDELYDLEEDPYELTNLIDDPEYSEIAEEGPKRLLTWRDDTDDPLNRWDRALEYLRLGRPS